MYRSGTGFILLEFRPVSRIHYRIFWGQESNGMLSGFLTSLAPTGKYIAYKDRKDRHAMKAAWELGELVVRLIERQFKYPERYDLPLNRIVRREYGIDMCPAMGRFKG